MAVNPQDLAEEQTQRAQIDAAGAPTEIATDPAQNQLAMGTGVKESLRLLLDSLGSAGKTQTPTDQAIPPAFTQLSNTQPQRIPTEQEEVIAPEGYDPKAAKVSLAPQILSEQGVKTFADRGFSSGNTRQAKIDEGAAAVDELLDDVDPVETEFNKLMEDANQSILNAFTGKKNQFDKLEDTVKKEADERADAPAPTGVDGINFDLLQTQEDVAKLLKQKAQSMPQLINKATRGKVPISVSKQKAAEAFADTFNTTQRILNKRLDEGLLTPEDLFAAVEILGETTKQMLILEAKILNKTATQNDKFKYMRLNKIVPAIFLQVTGNRSEYGRGLNLQKFMGGDTGLFEIAQKQTDMMAEDLGELTVEQIAKRARDIRRNDKGFVGFMRYHARAASARTADALGEAYLSGMLSGTGTFVRNGLGNTLWMAWQLPEEMIAGLFKIPVTKYRDALGLPNEDKVFATDALFRFKGYIDSFGDALRVAKVGFIREQPALGAKADLENYGGALRSKSPTAFGTAVNTVGQASRLFLRTLTTADEFFKTISQRGALYVEANHAYRNALGRGENNRTALDEAGMVLLSPENYKDELTAVARYNTLQDDIAFLSKPAGLIQRFRLGFIPIGRLLLPFAQTPANAIVKGVAAAFPFHKVFKALGTGTAAEQQKALAKFSMASMTGAYVVNEFVNGRMTGAMPSDKNERAALLAQKPGWQPNSYVMIKDKNNWPRDPETNELLPLYNEMGKPNGELHYLSLNGLEPVGSIIQLYTATAEAAVKTGIANDPDNPELMLDFIMSVMGATFGYYKEMPMLEGLADVAELASFEDVQDLKERLVLLARTPAEGASYFGVPNPVAGLQRQVMRGVDPTRLYPRGDYEYYTIDDVQAVDKNGDPVYYKIDENGKKVFDRKAFFLVGQTKSELTDQLYLAYKDIIAMGIKGSAFPDRQELEDEYLTKGYDSLGYEKGSEDISFANNHALAMWNSMTGIRIREGREPTELEQALADFYQRTGVWPLREPYTYGGLRLSKGARFDLLNQAKNVATLPQYDGMTFRDALEYEMTFPFSEYRQGLDNNTLTEEAALEIIQTIEDDYLDEGFRLLLRMPEHKNLAEAFRNKERATATIKRLGIIDQ